MIDLEHIKMLGDPHLGRSFTTGVPIHRRGDREVLQWEAFVESFDLHDVKMHVMMGDIFDKFVVAPEIVLEVEDFYRMVASDNPEVLFVLIQGNHDVSRNRGKASSFDLLKRMLSDVPNITFVCEIPKIIHGMGFVGFDAFNPVAEQMKALDGHGLTRIFTHHDFVDFGGDNVLPTEYLASIGITEVFNGHDHIARVEKRHGVEVHMVGSMQPYTHGEDPHGDLYKTVTLEELEKLGAAAADLNIRVRLKEGETLPADLDCLSLTAIRDNETEEETTVDTSEFESLELRPMVAKALEGLDCAAELLEMFDAS